MLRGPELICVHRLSICVCPQPIVRHRSQLIWVSSIEATDNTETDADVVRIVPAASAFPIHTISSRANVLKSAGQILIVRAWIAVFKYPCQDRLRIALQRAYRLMKVTSSPCARSTKRAFRVTRVRTVRSVVPATHHQIRFQARWTFKLPAQRRVHATPSVPSVYLPRHPNGCGQVINVCAPEAQVFICPDGSNAACGGVCRVGPGEDEVNVSHCIVLAPNQPGYCSCSCNSAAQCPAGYACSRNVIDTQDPARPGICLPISGYTCPLGNDSCLSLACVGQLEAELISRCTAPCTNQNDCPANYQCMQIPNEPGSYCVANPQAR